MRKALRLLLCLALCSTSLSAQEKKSKVKFGKFSEEEIAMKSYKNDPGAAAVVLFDRAEYTSRYSENGFVLEWERHVRIKIFKKEAYDLADIGIFHFKDEDITDLKASSYNLENGVMVESKVDKANIFDEKLTTYRMLKKLSIPAVREGSIIEYKYTRTNMGFVIPDWTFQDANYPTIWSEYKASVPSFLEFRKMSQGEVPFTLAEDEEVTNSSGPVSYKSHEMHYIQEDVPALKPESYVNSVKDYLSQINFDIRVIYQPLLEQIGGLRLVNGIPLERNRTWEKLGKELIEDVYEDPLGSGKFTADETATVIAGKSTTAEKITALYEFVGKNYQSNGPNIIWKSNTLDNITKNRKGTATDLNLILINMLRRAKVNAYPVAISTNSNGKILSYRVTSDAFNRILTAVENDDKTITILDASAWPHPIGFLPQEDLNREGLLLRAKDDITWIPLQNKSNVRSAVQAELALDAEGKISGPVSFSETGYGAVAARASVKDTDAPTYLREKFPDLFADGGFKNLKLENLENWQEPNVKGGFELESTGFASVSGNKIYLSPALGFGLKDNPFKNPERKFDIELGVPNSTVYNLVFAIPAGYKVEEAPKSTKFVFGENGLIFEYFTELSPEKVKISIRRNVKQPYIPVDLYADLQKFYGNIVSKLEEQVVLTKI